MAFCVKVARSAVSMCRFPELRRLRLAASMIEERSLSGIWTVILLVMDSWQSKCEARHQRRLSNRHCLVYSKLYDADGRESNSRSRDVYDATKSLWPKKSIWGNPFRHLTNSRLKTVTHNLTSWIGLSFLADSVNFLPKFPIPRLLFLPS